MILKSGAPEDVGMSAEGIKRAENVVQRLVDIGNTPSVVTLIARKGVIVLHKAFGKNGDAEDANDLTVDAIFPVCSITKVMTATGIMILVEDGLVGLNRPVADYIPEFIGEGKQDICVHHLLTHTSGLTDEMISVHAEKKKGKVEIPECDSTENAHIHERLFYGLDAPINEKPGKVMSYCSFGYMMLGEIIRRVSGKSYKDFMKERIFDSLGMVDTSVGISGPKTSRIVKRGSAAIFHEWLNSEECCQGESPAGGLYTTAMDLAIFASMFQNNGIYNGKRILSPASVATMTMNHIPGVSSEYRGEIFPEAYWGLGWGINGTKKDGGDLFSPQAYSHWGAAGVFFCVDPVYETIQVYLSVEIDHNKECKNIYADSFNNAALAAIEEL
jgi:CubicO group peptidase (beta-lactamase class C family)